MARPNDWVTWIADHRQDSEPASRHLLDDCNRGVQRVAGRYPGIYFELGCRTEEAMTSLVHRVFADLDARVIGRFPFSDRTPFDSYVAEAMPDREARYHSFSSRLSVCRETLRAQYSYNVRRHPAWLARFELHREVVDVLKAECATFPGRHPRYPRFGLRSWSDGRRPVRNDWNPDQLVRLLRARGGWSVEARVQLVLARHGTPMYPGQVSRILQDASVEPAAFGPIDDLASSQDAPSTDRLSVRRAAAACFAELESDERRLLGLLLAGVPYREIPAELPSLRNATAITRALQSICDGFLKRVLVEMGAVRSDAATVKPKEAAEMLLAVLVTLPDIRDRLRAEEGSP